jgi:acetyl-CoA carboxylase biotin carboxyl carrier protein
LDNKELKRLLDILNETGVTEFEMEKEGIKLKITRGGNSISISPENPASNHYIHRTLTPVMDMPEAITLPIVPSATSAPPAADVIKKAEETPLESQEGIHVIHSPIVGTFYRKPNPTADPYVEVGDKTKIGQVRCIVEAMKLMNEIVSDVVGEIVKIYAENASPVEYGEPLFAIKTI